MGGYNLESKLEMCDSHLKGWSDEKFGLTFRDLKKKRKQLKKLNKGALTDTQLEQCRSLVRDIAGLVKHEEAY